MKGPQKFLRPFFLRLCICVKPDCGGAVDIFGMPDTEADIVITPRRGKNEQPIPESGILLVNSIDANFAMRKLLSEGGISRDIHLSKLVVDRDNQFFLAGPAMSSPIAAMMAEKLIALGAVRIYLYSWCGAISPDLKIGNILVGDGAISGEGTSQYYSAEQILLPSPKAAYRLHQIARHVDSGFHTGNVWTTDAPYRENRQYLKSLFIEKNVLAVDMEYSALCAVCAFRKIQFAGIFIVSDELWGEKWKPGFKHPQFIATGKSIMGELINLKFHRIDG